MLKYGKLFLFVIFILLSFTNTIEARRYYNPRLGIWLTTDPLSDKFPGLSPYNYALNNPLRFIDPDGRNPILFLQRLAQAAQRFGNTRTWQAARTYGDKAVNYLRRDWVGFTQKVRNLPSRVRNDAARVFDSAKEIFKSSNVNNRVINATQKQLQIIFKHANDFGVTGNFNKENAAKFGEAITKHINSSRVKVIEGTFRGDPVNHYFDPNTKLNVIINSDGKFISGWKLGEKQIENILKHGGLN